MLASGRALNGANSSIKSRHDRTTHQGSFIESRQQQQQQQQQQPKKRRTNETTYLHEASRKKLQLNNESESINTSSASSSGYTSNNGALNLQHHAYGPVKGGSSAQLVSYLNFKPPQIHAHQLIINDEEVSPRMIVDKKLRQLPANGRHINHPHRHQSHLQHKQQQQYHQNGCSHTMMAQTSMVPIMIDDDDDVDGAVLIDDDIELACEEGDDSNGIIAANEHHDNNNNESDTISAFDPQALYGLRESHDMMRPVVDCIDSSASSRTTANGEIHYGKRYQEMLKQVKSAHQNGDSNNNRSALQSQSQRLMANTGQQHQHQQHHSTQTDAQTRLLVYNPIANYEFANSKQANSLVYQQSNLGNTNQFQQQYHSFSYHQPVQQLQLASSNQHLQYPAAYYQQLAASGATQADLEERGANSASGSVVDNSVIIKPVPDRMQVAAATAAAAVTSNKQTSSRRNKDLRRMQQGSRQHLSSPADQHQHHSTNSNRNNNNYSNKSGATSRKQVPVSSGRSNHQTTMPKNEPKALGCCGQMAKVLLFITNILFWSAGIALVAWGIYSLADDHKYNLSQLLIFEPSNKMSLFQLLSWSFITLGCAAVLVGFCGCSAILKNNRWILGLYIFLILAIFALDLATGLLAIIFQEKLVANVRLRLVNKLRSEYGVQASFTAAIDYIQTRFECCGLEGHFDYDQSLWRLQRLGGFEATVARTCCHLRNSFDDSAHINPRPVNESMCQSTDVRFHQSYRYRKGCLDDLERMVRQKIWLYTVGCGAVGGVILLSLLFATCFCRSIPSQNSRKGSSSDQAQPPSSNHYQQDKTNTKQTGGLSLAQAMDAQQQRHYR